jgi:hypothetical protein
MKLLKRHRVIAADLTRRYVEFHNSEDPRKIGLWGLQSWQSISKVASEGLILPAPLRCGWSKGLNWFTPSEEFLVKVVIPFIEIYRSEEGDRNLRWFEGNYPASVWSFNCEDN